MSYPIICIDLGNRHFTDVLIVDKLPAIGKPLWYFTFQAAEVKKIEPFTLPEQKHTDVSGLDFFTVTYRPLQLVEDHTKIIAKRKEKHHD